MPVFSVYSPGSIPSNPGVRMQGGIFPKKGFHLGKLNDFIIANRNLYDNGVFLTNPCKAQQISEAC